MKNKVLWTVLLVSAFLVACGAPSGQQAAAPEASNPADAGAPTALPTEIPAEPLLSVPGVGYLKPLTGGQGSGEKPLFIWDAFPGAARYQLMVFDEAGEPYWAWEGSETQIYMGGTTAQPPAGSSGPSIGPGYAWAVVAYDSGGTILAASEIRPISP